MSEKQSSVSLQDFFIAVERRLAQKFHGEWSSFQIEVCGKVIELRFDTREHAQSAKRDLRRKIVEPKRTPDAVFKYWMDDCKEYFPSEHLSSRWKICDEKGQFTFISGVGFMAENHTNKFFYYCRSSKNHLDPMTCSHSMYKMFFQWARSEGFLMLHAAAVGIGHKGILIAGQSGAGKSTLSAACLLTGFDYTGEDYIMLTKEGCPEAMPIYSSICLCADMAARLHPDMPRLWQRTDGKLEFDASAYPHAERLPIRGLIVPVIADEMKIVPVPVGTAVSRIAYSTARQMTDIPDPELVKAIVSRLSGLPAYEFRQCRDPLKNAKFLRQFILKEL